MRTVIESVWPDEAKTLIGVLLDLRFITPCTYDNTRMVLRFQSLRQLTQNIRDEHIRKIL